MTDSSEQSGIWMVVNVTNQEVVAEYSQAWPAHLKRTELSDDYEVRFSDSNAEKFE
jgi:hypothetical protein